MENMNPDLSIKNNSFLKKIHRRTKSNYDNYLENNLSKSDKLDHENLVNPPPKALHKTISSNYESSNKETLMNAEITNKIIDESKQKESNKEIFIEKLDLTPEEIIINHKKSDMNNAPYIFEFGRKKHIDLVYTKELETSKSSNFEERISQIRQKYQITDESDNFFVIPEQNNEIDENVRKDSFKDKIPIDFFQNKMKNYNDTMKKKPNGNIEMNNKKEKNINHQKTISLVLTRQNTSIKNNNNINISPNSENFNVMKIIQSLEKRVLYLENQVITLKTENLKLLNMNQNFQKTIENFSKDSNSAITVFFLFCLFLYIFSHIFLLSKITVNFEKRMQELERVLKKTQESFENIHRNVKSHILEEHIFVNAISSEKRNRLNKEKEEIQVKTMKINEENNNSNINNMILKKTVNFSPNTPPLRKSLDSNLTKSTNNFFEKTLAKNEIEGNLNDYILRKGGKIMNNLTQKKIFLTPKAGVYLFKLNLIIYLIKIIIRKKQ